MGLAVGQLLKQQRERAPGEVLNLDALELIAHRFHLGGVVLPSAATV